MPDWKGAVKDPRSKAKSLVGRGDKSSSRNNSTGNTVPIQSLRDPNSFAPPPKHTGYYGPTPGSTGGGALTAEPEEVEPAEPPKPFQLDTSGLTTAHLPPPPGRRDGADGRPIGTQRWANNNSPANTTGAASMNAQTRGLPPSVPARGGAVASPTTATKAPPPSLPPRLPPRSDSGSSTSSPSSGYINQAAANRLGGAGISVPALGIGGGGVTTASPPPRPPAARPAIAPATGVAGIARSMNGLQLGQQQLQQQQFQRTGAGGAAEAAAAVVAKKKPAPPPPKKKPGIMPTGTGDEGTPPPIPMATRPTF